MKYTREQETRDERALVNGERALVNGAFCAGMTARTEGFARTACPHRDQGARPGQKNLTARLRYAWLAGWDQQHKTLTEAT